MQPNGGLCQSTVHLFAPYGMDVSLFALYFLVFTLRLVYSFSHLIVEMLRFQVELPEVKCVNSANAHLSAIFNALVAIWAA